MFDIPASIAWINREPEGREWLRRLPERVDQCAANWGLTLSAPYPNSYVSIVFPATRRNGSRAVLKIQYPHRESDYEHEALRLWNGHGAARLLGHDQSRHALLLERCEPGEHLSARSADEALAVFIGMLPRLWIPAAEPFRSLFDESAGWIAELPESWERAGRPFERAMLDTALDSLQQLRMTQREALLIHQDLHADNVLRATREPWLAIDPKPLVGERAFSLAPIIRSYELGHSRQAVIARLDRLTSALGVDRERARLWAMGQTLAWSFFGSTSMEGHVQTARWLWEA